jgi:hypothetical protein
MCLPMTANLDSASSARIVTGPKCFASELTMIQDCGEGTMRTAMRDM